MKITSDRIAITGKPGCGKTTLCKKIAEKARDKTGGLITEEIRESGKRVGFRLEDLATGETGLLSHVRDCSGPKVGKYSVCLDQLDAFVARAIESGSKEKDLLIIDEIGPMELKSERFVNSVEETLESDTACLFTVHRSSKHPLVERIKDECQLIKLTRKNRDKIFEKIYGSLLQP